MNTIIINNNYERINFLVTYIFLLILILHYKMQNKTWDDMKLLGVNGRMLYGIIGMSLTVAVTVLLGYRAYRSDMNYNSDKLEEIDKKIRYTAFYTHIATVLAVAIDSYISNGKNLFLTIPVIFLGWMATFANFITAIRDLNTYETNNITPNDNYKYSVSCLIIQLLANSMMIAWLFKLIHERKQNKN